MQSKLILPLQSSGKMEVTPQQSEILQRELFKMGFNWYTETKQKIINTEKPFIIWDQDKDITYTISRNLFDEYFDENSIELHLFDNHFKIDE